MAQGVWRDVLLNASSARRALASKPNHLVGDRYVGSPAIDQTWE
jgi:hypothetical protein